MGSRQLVVVIALSIVFAVSSVIAIVNAAKVGESILTSYVFQIEEEYCENYTPRPVDGTEEVSKQQDCGVNYVRAKRNIVEGSVWLAVSLLASASTFREMRRLTQVKSLTL